VQPRVCWRLFAVGAPMATSGLLFCGVYLALSRMLAGMGVAYIAALGIGHRIESIAYEFCEGFEVATAALVGQNVGAGRAGRAWQVARAAARQMALFVLPFGCGVALLAGPVCSAFSGSPVVREAAAQYLRWNGGVFFFMGLELVAEGAFTGWGRTMPALLSGAAGNLLRVPLAAGLAASGMGANGVWAAIALTTVLKGLLKLLWFRRMSVRGQPPSELAALAG